MTEPTPQFGLTRDTRKLADFGAARLSEAINSLAEHHETERGAYEEREFKLMDALAKLGANSEQRAQISPTMNIMRPRIDKLRHDREELLETLLPMRPPLVDMLREAASLRDGAIYQKVAPYDSLEGVPEPLGGVEPDPFGQIQILMGIAEWTARLSVSFVAMGLGPAYSLPFIIRGSSAEAQKLHADLRKAHDLLRRFVVMRVAG